MQLTQVPPVDTPPAAATRSSKRRILLIEDDVDQAALMIRWLERNDDWRVVWHPGAGGIGALFNDNTIDIVLCDIELPQANGVDIAREFKAHAPEIPVVLLTAHNDVTLFAEAFEAGVDEFMLKPVARQRLLGRVENLLAQDRPPRRGKVQRSILAIGAHPDDVEIGCGATLARHVRDGDRVVIMTLTSGGNGGDKTLRRAESTDAAAALGAELVMKDLPDTQVSAGQETISEIEREIARVRPDVIYVHSDHDRHQDHRNVYQATCIAARRVPTVLLYQSPSSTIDFRPTVFGVVDETMEAKIDLIERFASQGMRTYLDPATIMATARYWARFNSGTFAEPFEVLRQTR